MLYDDNKIEEINYKIYLQWFNEFTKDIPPIGIIYVRASPEICFERVVSRGREGEEIPLSYLKNCHDYHNNWLEKQDTILTLDANETKSNTITSYATWIKIINNFIKQPKIDNIDLYTHASLCCDTHGV